MYTAVSGGGAGAGAGAGATESPTAATTTATTEHSKKAATSAMQAAGQHALVHVSRFLGATELARLSCVNKFTHGVLDDPSSATMDKAWAECCKQAWEEKCVPRLQVSTSTMLHDADLSGAGVAAMLSIKQMKHVLRKRRVSARDCFEKHELADRVASTTPSTCRAHGSTFGSRWKAAFAAAQAEGSRRDITKEDLCDLAWTLYMPMHGDPNHVAYERQQNFKPDFTYNSFMHDRPLDWELIGDNRVRIGPYPPLKAQRNLSDWGWVLTNDYVMFTSSLPVQDASQSSSSSAPS